MRMGELISHMFLRKDFFSEIFAQIYCTNYYTQLKQLKFKLLMANVSLLLISHVILLLVHR